MITNIIWINLRIGSMLYIRGGKDVLVEWNDFFSYRIIASPHHKAEKVPFICYHPLSMLLPADKPTNTEIPPYNL